MNTNSPTKRPKENCEPKLDVYDILSSQEDTREGVFKYENENEEEEATKKIEKNEEEEEEEEEEEKDPIADRTRSKMTPGKTDALVFMDEAREFEGVTASQDDDIADDTNAHVAESIILDNEFKKKVKSNKLVTNLTICKTAKPLQSAEKEMSGERTECALNTPEIIKMFHTIEPKLSESINTNAQINIVTKMVISEDAAKRIKDKRDNTAANLQSKSPPAEAQMKYVWGKGIVDWVKGPIKNNDIDRFNVCYLCGHKILEKRDTTSEEDLKTARGPNAWDYPEVEHKIPCTTAFMLFPNMDNLRWYYPYYTPPRSSSGRTQTHRANLDHRDLPWTKSMYELWMDYTPSTNFSGNRVPPSNETAPSSRYVHLYKLYGAINGVSGVSGEKINDALNRVKNNFTAYIHSVSSDYTREMSINNTVVNYAWEVICLWLMELAGSHKACNQRKSQYNLMTSKGRSDAKKRTYVGSDDFINDAFDERNESLKKQVPKHLCSIIEQYNNVCSAYVSVSAGTMFKGLDPDRQLELVKISHIWDNFRRMVLYIHDFSDSSSSSSSDPNSGPRSKKPRKSGGGTRRRHRKSVGKVRRGGRKTRRKSKRRRKSRRRKACVVR